MIESPHGSPAGNRTLVSLARILTSILPRSEPEHLGTKTNFALALEEKQIVGARDDQFKSSCFPMATIPNDQIQEKKTKQQKFWKFILDTINICLESGIKLRRNGQKI